MKFPKNCFKIFFVLLFVFSIAPFFAKADEIEFNVDSSYDYLGRTKVKAFLHNISENAYFYVEDDFYKNLDVEEKKALSDSLKQLTLEFDQTIYPKVREKFGTEWNPGIDNDRKITVLITQIKGDAGGYFNEADEYPKIQAQKSNEREMVYINSKYIADPLVKSFLAHEFLHLITFFQKEKTYGISDEIWLNEGRAEYLSTFLGYDNDYQNSNLQRRVKTFIQNPQDSLTEWRNLNSDYGALNLFVQYLVDHYGISILIDSLHSNEIGISSINSALKKNNFSEDFSKIFTDWSIAVLINNCQISNKYCYLNQNLKNLKITPQLNYLPLTGEITLTFTYYSKNWTGNWYKIIGGQGTLKLEFIKESENVKFKVPYLKRELDGDYIVSFLDLDTVQQSIIYIPNFGTSYDSLIIIPSIQQKTSGFDGDDTSYQFIWSVSVVNTDSQQGEEDIIQKLLSQIELLKKEIEKLKAQLGNQNQGNTTISCNSLNKDLSYGIQNNQEVKCLQEFLKNQGKDIYPEGLVTGNFLTLTRSAVIRFQEKYALEILNPIGLQKGTGYVGTLTRTKINNLINK